MKIDKKWNQLVGTKINNWEITKYLGRGNETYRTFYLLALCPRCGNETKLRTHLISKQKSCNQCKKEKCREGYNWKGVGEIPQTFFRSYYHSSKAKNLEFEIDLEYLWDLFLKQNRKCALTGRELHFRPSEKEKIKQTASIDRIDSTKGYIKGNIQWVHKEINFLKSNYDNNLFINICKEIAEYNK